MVMNISMKVKLHIKFTMCVYTVYLVQEYAPKFHSYPSATVSTIAGATVAYSIVPLLRDHP